MNVQDGYHRLGLQRNPFIADPTPGIAPQLWIETGRLVPRSGEIVQLIGNRGAGKTTQLLHWQHETGGAYRHVLPGRQRWARLPIADRIYWDEADRVPHVLLRQAIKAAARIKAAVAIGTHIDLAPRLESSGFVIRTHQLGHIAAMDVEAWAAQRIANTQLDGHAAFSLGPDLAESVAEESGGSWRVVGDQLHAWVAQRAMDF